MSLALLRKELQEHGVVLGGTLLLSCVGLLVLSNLTVDSGRFVPLTRFMLVFGTLIALVLANRLIAREYTGRTQLFLETLPIGRARVFASKWLLGCALMLTLALVAWRVTLIGIRMREVMPMAEAAGPLYCMLTFALALWSVAALGAMLGRYRYIVWGLVAGVIFMSASIAGIPYFDMPVLRLVGADVQMAAGMPAQSDFITVFAISAGAALVTAVLALHGSGAMASALARRMTSRERAFVFVSIIAVVIGSFLLEPKPEQPPFQLAGGELFEGRHTRVSVMPTQEFGNVEARVLARTVTNDVDSTIELLGLDIVAPVFIVPQSGLDRHVMQRAYTGNAQGIVLRVAPDAATDMIRSLVLHALLMDSTHGRGMRDDMHALLDGFAGYWAVRESNDDRALWWMRAVAIEAPIDRHLLLDWSETTERFGDCRSLALGFAVVDTLFELLGREKALDVLGEILRTPHDDIRVLLEAGPKSLLQRAGVGLDELIDATEAALQQAGARHATRLAQRPDARGSIDWTQTPGRGIEVVTQVEGIDRYSAYYTQLAPWTASIGNLPRFDVLGMQATLPISPAPGSRYYVALEYDDPVLDCPIRIAAERLEFK